MEYVTRMFIFIVLGIAITHGVRWLVHRIDLLLKPLNQQVVGFIFLTLLAGILLATIEIGVFHMVNLETKEMTDLSFFGQLVAFGFNSFVYLFIWNCIYFIHHYVDKTRKQQLDTLKLESLVKELELKTAGIDQLEDEIAVADIILVATNAERPVILASHINPGQSKLIIDLSIPFNVEESVRHLPNIHLVNVDELSKLKDDTLKKREAEVPKAKAIIAESMEEFIEWYQMRRHVPMLKDLKIKLKSLHSYSLISDPQSPLCEEMLDLKIQRVVNETAGKIKKTDTKGCQYIAAINEFICTA